MADSGYREPWFAHQARLLHGVAVDWMVPEWPAATNNGAGVQARTLTEV